MSATVDPLACNLVPMDNDSFTISDRKELIKQGVQLENLRGDLGKLGDVISRGIEKLDEQKADRSELALNVVTDHEKRIRNLEDSRLEFKTQIRTSIWWIGIASAVIGALGGAIGQAVFRGLGLK